MEKKPGITLKNRSESEAQQGLWLSHNLNLRDNKTMKYLPPSQRAGLALGIRIGGEEDSGSSRQVDDEKQANAFLRPSQRISSSLLKTLTTVRNGGGGEDSGNSWQVDDEKQANAFLRPTQRLSSSLQKTLTTVRNGGGGEDSGNSRQVDDEKQANAFHRPTQRLSSSLQKTLTTVHNGGGGEDRGNSGQADDEKQANGFLHPSQKLLLLQRSPTQMPSTSNLMRPRHD
ncbi:hypothetical protein CsSME_00029651 [Camellia sinensis var. sinensis]